MSKAEENTYQRYGEIIVGPPKINLQHNFSSCITSSILSFIIVHNSWKLNFFDILTFYVLLFSPQINIDHSTKATIEKNILKPTRSCFDVAQSKIYGLMKRDCYPRFLTSDIYLTLTKRAGPPSMARRRSRSFVFNERPEGTTAWL